MIQDVYSYLNYKGYLNEFISAQPKRGRGLKLKIAEAIGCKVAYVSQVLRGDHNFSLEQATLLSEFMGHSDEERHFFLLLIQMERAGSVKLRNYFREQIDVILERRNQMKNRFQTPQTLMESEQAKYYSSWIFAAVHILITIPEFRTKEAIAARLKIDLSRLNEILEFLLSCGLLAQEGDHYVVGKSRIYLGNDSPLTPKVHSNWRLRAIDSVERETKRELHYSSVVSVSASDVKKIRERLMQEIEAVRGIVRDSKEEDLFAICVDWFRV